MAGDVERGAWLEREREREVLSETERSRGSVPARIMAGTENGEERERARGGEFF